MSLEDKVTVVRSGDRVSMVCIPSSYVSLGVQDVSVLIEQLQDIYTAILRDAPTKQERVKKL